MGARGAAPACRDRRLPRRVDFRDRCRRAGDTRARRGNRAGSRCLAGRVAPCPGRQFHRRAAGALGLGRVVRALGACRPLSQGRQALGRPAGPSRGIAVGRAGGYAVRADPDITSTATSPTCCTGSTAIPARGRQDLRDSGDIGSYGRNLRRIPSRFWKCYIGRKGYREGQWGFVIALCAALYPILSYLKARLEAPRPNPQLPPARRASGPSATATAGRRRWSKRSCPSTGDGERGDGR